MTKPLISIVVICKRICDYNLTHTFPAISKQTYANWELLILPDRPTDIKIKKGIIIPTWPKLGPADKKDLGINAARGEIIAFIDDDAYPEKDWLETAVPYFTDDSIAAVCGPGITPPDDPLLNQVSGWFWASPLGSGGAGTYRCWPGEAREVDDYPTFNLIARKSDLLKVDGFDSNYWPGEDTKLCHDIVYKLRKRICYVPKIVVYHQRRPVLMAHLKQLGRYGLHRGYFAKTLPKTSRRIGYVLPAIFSLGIIGGVTIALLHWLAPSPLSGLLFYVFIGAFGVYFLADLLNSFWVLVHSRSLLVTLVLIPVTLLSHVFYGLMFIRGLGLKGLVSKYSRNQL